MALEKPRKLGEFFLLLFGHPGAVFMLSPSIAVAAMLCLATRFAGVSRVCSRLVCSQPDHVFLLIAH